jgi:hypothetical protein
VGKLEGKQPPGRLNHKFQDNIEMKLRELGRDKLEQFFCITRTVQIAIINTSNKKCA